MIHWTPLQERGESDSPYSIKNQLVYDRSLFGDNVDSVRGEEMITEILEVARNQYGLLGLTDVVLNHTASDSLWLADHPEAGKSLSHVHRTGSLLHCVRI